MESNEDARPSDSGRISNEGAPPADPEDRRRGGGPPWGRIIAALIGLLLLALLIPLACQALRGNDPGSGAGSTGGEQQGAAGGTTGGEARGGGSSTPGAGGTSAPAGGDTSATGGGTTGGEIAGSPSAGGAAATGAALDVGGQQSGDGTTVTVPRAEISGADGWLVIHADDNGQPGEVLGHAPLREGQNTDVAVRLDGAAPSGRLYAMVHADDPDDDRYTFPDGDPPVEANGQPVEEPIEYTVSGDQAGRGLPASGGPPVMPALLVGGIVLALAAGAFLSLRLLAGRKY